MRALLAHTKNRRVDELDKSISHRQRLERVSEKSCTQCTWLLKKEEKMNNKKPEQ